MTQESVFFSPLEGFNEVTLVRPYIEEAFRSGDADMADLSVEVQPDIRVPLSQLALSATLPAGQSELSRDTASLVMSALTETVLEIAILKLSDNLGIDYEEAYTAVFDGKKHAPISSSLFSDRSHPSIRIDRLMTPFLQGEHAGTTA